jgi:8-oxo-dGTP diphosphatase
VDCVVFGLDEQELKVMLIQRGLPPFEGKWALPGGFVRLEETLDEAARRELEEETGLSRIFLEQLYTFSEVDRDPRERVVSVAYYALVNLRDHQVHAATDARDAGWFGVHDVPSLAFDHAGILRLALERLRGKLRYQPVGFELLPRRFTLSELQHLYELVLERTLDKRNFRKRVLAMDLLEETDEVQQDVAHRAARLYRFDERKYRRLLKTGFHFELCWRPEERLMRAIVQSKYGAPSEVLRLAEIPQPAIAEDELLVRVRAASVHADIWHAVTGRPYSWRIVSGWRAPKRPVPGTDIAGVVASVGMRVTRFKPGDEVFGETMRSFTQGNGGAFAEYASAPEQSLVLKPQNVTFEQAASVPASGYIAFANLIRVGAVMDGQHVVVNGAGGGVGTIALQMLRARGAHVTAVDAGPKLRMLRSLGADETIDYTLTNFTEQGIQYDLIFDIASNLSLQECKRALKPAGLYVWIGHEHYGRAKDGRFLGRGFPQMFGLMARSVFGDPNLPRTKFPIVIPGLKDAIAAMRDLMAEGKLIPFVETYPLESVAEAFRALEKGKVLGKVVLVPAGS